MEDHAGKYLERQCYHGEGGGGEGYAVRYDR